MEFNCYNSLFEAIITEDLAIRFAIRFRLIKTTGRLCECGSDLICSNDNSQKLKYRFRCCNSSNICKKTYSILHGTWFWRSHLSIRDQILMIYCYCLELNSIQMMSIFGLGSVHSVADWQNYFRDLCAIYLSETNNHKIGGPNLNVEIDETKIFKNKNRVGRLTNEQEIKDWVFGGICRETKETFFCIVADRSANSLMELLQNNVEVGTHVISDCWSSYNNISNYGYTHSRINHSQNFILPNNPNVHTQTIERAWRGLKENIPRGSRYESRLEYIIQYSFKRKCNWYSLNTSSRFLFLLNLIAEYY